MRDPFRQQSGRYSVWLHGIVNTTPRCNAGFANIRRACARTTLDILVLALIVLLAGCVSFAIDAPSDLRHLGNSWGVATVSIQPPYRIYSISSLQGSGSTVEQGSQDGVVQKIARGCYRQWCWSILGTSPIAAAWRAWLNRRHACVPESTRACLEPVGWDLIFRHLYATAATLVGRAPIPLDLHLLLLPPTANYHRRIELQSDSHVPLEFAVHFPVDRHAPGFPLQVRKGLVSIAATAFYEYQHVEYAAHGTSGPKAPITARTVKNEANSECWALSARVVLGRVMGIPTYVPRVTRLYRQLTMAEAGGPPSFSTAAAYGPLFLEARLQQFLLKRYPDLKDGPVIIIPPKDQDAQHALLAYCAHFSRDPRGVIPNPAQAGMRGTDPPRDAQLHDHRNPAGFP